MFLLLSPFSSIYIDIYIYIYIMRKERKQASMEQRIRRGRWLLQMISLVVNQFNPNLNQISFINNA
jgi:hypothetical protein